MTTMNTEITYHDEPVRLRAGIILDSIQYQDAAEMYRAYGAAVTDADCNSVELQAVSPADLEKHDDSGLVAILKENGNGDVADELVALARRVYAAMQEIEAEIELAIEAAAAGDLERTVDALSLASRLERDHGDDPATKQVVAQLLEFIEDEDS